MALICADAAADGVDFGSGTSIDNLSTGTVAFWVKPTSVANALRNVVSNNNGGLGWAVFQRGADGTNWTLKVNRATTDQDVDTGSVMTAGAWQFVAFTWSIASGGPKSYRGLLTTSVAAVTTSAVDGSGAFSPDTSGSLVLAQGVPATFAWLGIWNRVLSLGELKDQQFHPHVTSGNVVFAHPGYNGTTSVPNWSGNGNNGTITGTPTVAAHVPLGPLFGRKRAQSWAAAVAAAGNPWYAYAQQ